MQIHFALSEPPRWEGDERLGKTAIVHLTPGLDGVSRAVNEADRGLLPTEATVVVGQPLAVDDSRAPAGKGILWIQLQELPWQVKGDAAGELDVGDGTWNESLRERYADRIQARIARHVPNLESSILRRVVPGDLQKATSIPSVVTRTRLAGARPELLRRPFARQPGHRIAVDGPSIGASIRPGPGPRRAPDTGREGFCSAGGSGPPGGSARLRRDRTESPASGHVSDLADHDPGIDVRG
jgi:phytoene dehydrogenase-like protein